MKDCAVQKFESKAEDLLAVVFHICESNVGAASCPPKPSHKALCAAAIALQEAIKSFSAAVRAA